MRRPPPSSPSAHVDTQAGRNCTGDGWSRSEQAMAQGSDSHGRRKGREPGACLGIGQKLEFPAGAARPQAVVAGVVLHAAGEELVEGGDVRLGVGDVAPPGQLVNGPCSRLAGALGTRILHLHQLLKLAVSLRHRSDFFPGQ